MLYFHYGRHQLAILKPNAVNVMGCYQGLFIGREYPFISKSANDTFQLTNFFASILKPFVAMRNPSPKSKLAANKTEVLFEFVNAFA